MVHFTVLFGTVPVSIRCLWTMFKCSYGQKGIIMVCYQLLQEFLEVFIKSLQFLRCHLLNNLWFKWRKVKINANTKKTRLVIQSPLLHFWASWYKRPQILPLVSPNLQTQAHVWDPHQPHPPNEMKPKSVFPLFSQTIFKPAWKSALLSPETLILWVISFSTLSLYTCGIISLDTQAIFLVVESTLTL